MSFLKELAARKKLIKAFRSGGIYLGDRERPIYPKIKHVEVKKDSTEFIFYLPTGLDPKALKKNMFAFHQVFGEALELNGDVKRFSLTVYDKQSTGNLKYNSQDIIELVSEHKLGIICGKKRTGEYVTFDLLEKPHILIAGETGSGKSTQLRSILASLIMAIPPERLELYLCDLKRSEFHLFKRIVHVKGDYVSAKQMIPMLKYLQNELRYRGDMLNEAELAHIDDLDNPPSYIVVCIDEVALLQNEREIMGLVEEISSIGRALGVFLILSMQRPDSKVLDGKLKNNLTVRMGFRCADLINSRVIGTPGSEKLTVPGRMLLKLPDKKDLLEIQAPYLTLEEAKKILEPYKTRKPKNPTSTPPVQNETTLFGVLDDEN